MKSVWGLGITEANSSQGFLQVQVRARGKFKALIHKPELAVDLSLTQTRSQALKAI